MDNSLLQDEVDIRDRGEKTAELGTSSENVDMQRLAESLGFTIVSESLWFSRAAY